MVSRLYIFIYIYILHLVDTFIQSDLQMKKIEIYVLCVLSCIANKIYAKAILSSVFYQL